MSPKSSLLRQRTQKDTIECPSSYLEQTPAFCGAHNFAQCLSTSHHRSDLLGLSRYGVTKTSLGITPALARRARLGFTDMSRLYWSESLRPGARSSYPTRNFAQCCYRPALSCRTGWSFLPASWHRCQARTVSYPASAGFRRAVSEGSGRGLKPAATGLPC